MFCVSCDAWVVEEPSPQPAAAETKGQTPAGTVGAAKTANGTSAAHLANAADRRSDAATRPAAAAAAPSGPLPNLANIAQHGLDGSRGHMGAAAKLDAAAANGPGSVTAAARPAASFIPQKQQEVSNLDMVVNLTV